MKILLFSHDGKLGDAVVNTAFIRGAHLLDPAVELHVLASDTSASFWQNDSRIAKIWPFANPPLWECFKTCWAIRRERFDYVVTFKERFRSEKTRLLLALAAPRRATLREGGKQTGQVTHAVHKSQWSLQAIYGARAREHAPRYALAPSLPTPAARARLDALLAGAGLPEAPLVLLNLFGAEPVSRTITTEDGAALLRQLTQALPHAVVALSCTHATEALARAALARAASPACGIVNTDGDLDTLIALCQRAQLVISPDTSLIHIASALDTAVVGIYQNDGIKPIEWAPLCSRFAIVVSPDAGSIQGFSVQEVVHHARALCSS